MRTRDIKSLNETIASVVDPIDADRAKALQEGYLNSLTEKARQICEETIEEKAAPGMEDWASDPKVKASFEKQYGKRWKEVMYGRSWNLAKKEKELGVNEEAELDLAEGVSAKRMRVIRKHLVSGKPVTGKVKDFMDRSIQKQLYRDKTKFSGATPAYPSYLERARRKHSAMKAKGLAEADQLDEGKGGRSNFTNLMKRQVSRVRRAGGREDVQREIGNYTEREAAGGESKMSYQARRAMSDAGIEARIKERDAKKAKRLAEAEQLDELKVLGSIKTGFKKGGLVGAVKSGAKALKHNIKRGGIVGDTADARLRDNFLSRATNKAIDKNSPHGTAAAARAVARVSKLKNIKGLRRRFKGAVESKFSDRTQHTVKPMIAARVAQFNAANTKKSVSEANELNEADYKKLMRLKKKAYNTRNPKVVRATAELEAKVAANMARRGGASADAIRAGGSRIGKSGKYTQKAGNLANQRDRALAKFRGRAVAGGAFNPPGPEKRKRQQAQAEFSNRARSGDFGQNNQEGMRPRYNYLKRTGKLKTYK
jgi:hypothetical protein